MIIFAILLFILFTPWRLTLDFGDIYKVRLLWFGLAINLHTGKKFQTESFKPVSWKRLRLYWKIYKESKIQVVALSLELSLGTGQPPLTAILIGSLWALWGSLGPFLPSHCRFVLVPVFKDEPVFQGSFRCILRFIPGHIILIGIKNLIEFYLKGGAKNG